MARVKIAVVVGSHLGHRGQHVRGDRLAVAFGLVDRRPMDGHDSGFALHHAHPPGWPRDDEVGVEPLPGHGIVARTGGVIDGEDDPRNGRGRHGLDELGPGANDPRVFRLRPDHETTDVLNEHDRNPFPAGRVDEVRHLLGTLGVDDAAEVRALARLGLDEAALVGDDGHRPAFDPPMAADHFRGHRRLEFLEHAAVEHAGKHVAHVVGHPMILGQDVVQVLDRPGRCHGGCEPVGDPRQSREPGNILADLDQARRVVRREVVGDGADFGMGFGPAQRLAVDGLAGGALDQVGAAESHEAGSVHHEDHVRQGREVRPARNATPHDRGDLRHLEIAPHDRVVIEDPRRTILAGKDPALIRKVDPGAIDQIDDRDPLPHRDFLGPENLGDGFGPPGTGLDRRVVRDDHDFAALDNADPGNHACPGRLAVIPVGGNQETDLEPRSAGIEKPVDPLPGRQLALGVHLRHPVGATSGPELVRERAVLAGEDTEPAQCGRRGFRRHGAILDREGYSLDDRHQATIPSGIGGRMGGGLGAWPPKPGQLRFSGDNRNGGPTGGVADFIERFGRFRPAATIQQRRSEPIEVEGRRLGHCLASQVSLQRVERNGPGESLQQAVLRPPSDDRQVGGDHFGNLTGLLLPARAPKRE